MKGRILCGFALTRTVPQYQFTTYKLQFSDKLRKYAFSSDTKRKYQETLILPKTEFPLRVPSDKRKQHEIELCQRLEFEKLYERQKLWRRDQPEFILHDGPPYANGEPHVGHAVNKILKDITNRYKLLRGYRINYIPGWDCHGLPIELKTIKEQVKKKHEAVSEVAIRKAARQVAMESIEVQKRAFKRWNIMADWNTCYHTFDRNYVKSELKLFYSLYEKGFVYRSLKPVFWSPSSQTALAEAELEYNKNHESMAVFLALSLNMNLQEFLLATDSYYKESSIDSNLLSRPVDAIIWTTTAWSLPANKAVAFNEREKYSIVFKTNSHSEDRIFYVVASDQVPLMSATVGTEYRVVLEFPGSKLAKVSYHHPWFEDEKCPMLHSDHVVMDKGTGLVHIAPAHGNDDYVIGLKHNLKVDCYVDDKGNFDSRLASIQGLCAMTAGTSSILQKLQKKIIYKEKYTHSYPYDWRTKKPVLTKTSMQWFIDTGKLKDSAAEAFRKVKFSPENIQNGMLNQIMARPFWCISRQRVWGVPIPVLYNKNTGEPLVDKSVVDNLCKLIDMTGDLDCWWTCPVSDLIQQDDADYVKGKDIFDIWLDSGVSWHILNDKIADLYLEGTDQFTGWFQSSLLTSLAIRGSSPYKNIFVHGFVVDGENRKMSKSEGNVVHPAEITDGRGADSAKALGVDVLRWWVATQGSADGDSIVMSNSLMRSAEESVQKLRAVLRFIVSFVNENVIENLDIDEVTYEELLYTDQYMLSQLYDFQKSVTADFDNFKFHRAITKTLHFTTTEISAQYLTWVKDRLYCDLEDSQSRKSAIFVLNQLYLALAKTIAPVLPFLAEESFTYYSSIKDSIFKYTWFNNEETVIWDNSSVREMFDLAMDVRGHLNQLVGMHNKRELWVEIICNQQNYKMLQVLHPDRCNSELCDLLEVSGVVLNCSDLSSFTSNPFGVSHSLKNFSVGVTKSVFMQCVRCRRYCCPPEANCLCSRCQSVLKRVDQRPLKPSQPTSPKVVVTG